MEQIMTPTITLIKTFNLRPHPKNPRRDLGDLTELSDSIREQGIMQPLTVVPDDSPGRCRNCFHYLHVSSSCTKEAQLGAARGRDSDGNPLPCEEWEHDGSHIIVMGHRRHAAAEIAGLKEIPCIARNMTEREQVAAMMSENMQRSDLDVQEEAKGFQMMLDLGETVETAAKATGVSQSTVRRRVKLMELDQGKLRESLAKGGTLQNYIDLERIKDIDTRNEVLNHIGTNNFDWELRKAVEKETFEEARPVAIELLMSFALEISDEYQENNDISFYTTLWLKDFEKWELPDDDKEYFYKDYGEYVQVYHTTEETEQNESEREADLVELDRQARRKQAAEVAKRAYWSRKTFVKNLNIGMAMTELVLGFAADALVSCPIDYKMATVFMDAVNADGEYANFEEAIFMVRREHEGRLGRGRFLFMLSYCSLEPGAISLMDWTGGFNANNTSINALRNLYLNLATFGYEISDEEAAMLDGSHEMYLRDYDDDCEDCICFDCTESECAGECDGRYCGCDDCIMEDPEEGDDSDV
ncbi:MAG: ParB/RepB/Spo0J family partition protein [Oscillospiraceae bacterium]|nr:ParB/RepB/Spo0J family partition protein [Oscillospiraceae bacterium]